MAAAVAAGTGCRGSDAERPRLLGGVRAAPVPAALQRLGERATVSRVRVLRASQLDPPGRDCVDGFRDQFDVPAQTVVVARTGRLGGSLTLADAERRVVLGCDRTAAAATGKRWCASSAGRLRGGAVPDMRLDVLCRGADGEPVGFGWVEPAMRTRWVVVSNGRERDVEQVAAGLPVRVATTTVVRDYVLTARVAG